MRIELRQDDAVDLNDDIVLRAGGGSVDNLVMRAVENAVYYRALADKGLIESPWTISVHIPREGLASKSELLQGPPYSRYRPYLEARARDLLQLHYLQIAATTLTVDGVDVSAVDLCHFDLVISAGDEDQLRNRISEIRGLFRREDNPYRDD